ncbi:MAG: CPBP family intramembrane metalloprotease [Firmicutes bacterium]|nr:CPBP family intramembrane metalloprotease [Bacillota bacterium]
MNRTSKLSLIFFITILGLTLSRIISQFVNLADNYHSWLFSFLMQVGFLGVVPLVLYRVMFKADTRTFLADMRIKTKIKPQLYGLAVAIGLVTFLLNIIVSNLFHSVLLSLGFTYSEGVGTLYNPENLRLLILFMGILTTAVLPAIFEEICDRGLLLACLENEKSERRKMLFVALMFGLAHQNIAQFGTTAVIGYIFAYMVIKCGSILPAIIVHFMNNLFVVLSGYSSQNSEVFSGALNGFARFSFGSVFALFAVTVAVIMLIHFALKVFASIAKEGLPKEIGTSAGGKLVNYEVRMAGGEPVIMEKSETSETANLNNAPESNYDIFLKGAKRKAPLARAKTPHKDYIFLYIGAGLAGAITLFTFVWGLLR